MYVVGYRNFESEIEGLKSIVEGINKIKDEAILLNKKSAEILEIKPDKEYPDNFYESPLYHLENKIKDIAGEALEKLAAQAFHRWINLLFPNSGATLDDLLRDITIEYEEHFLHGGPCKRERTMLSHDLRDGLDPKWLFDLFVKKYVGNAKEISEAHLLSMAKGFLPHQFTGEPAIQVKDILFGNILRFQNVHEERWSSSYRAQNIALTKLARVILRNENIITVDDSVNLFGVKHFKNGRYDVIFDSEEDARKVAEVLINGFPKEG